MPAILPRDLTPAGTVNPASAIIIDDGSGVKKATPAELVDSGRPIASQGEAEAGVVSDKGMTPQRVKQAIDALGVSQAVLASSTGADMVGSLSPFPDAAERPISDRAADSRSVLEWFSDAERDAARAGDLSLDMTAAIGTAFNSGAPVIDMHDYRYRIDTVVNLPVAGVKITGKGWSAERGAGVVNNGDKMFYSINATGRIEFENGVITGNVDREGDGYSSFAAGIYVESSTGGLSLTGMQASGFTSGAYLKYVDGVQITGGAYTGNILTGISGFIKNFVIEGSNVSGNGFASSGGLNHNLYLINSAHGVIRNNFITDPLDPASSNLAIRYDQSGEATGYDEMVDCDVYGNIIGGGDARITSDPGSGGVEARKPPTDIRVFQNVFTNEAGLRFDDPQNCKSWGNKGINALTVGVLSSYSGYVIGYISEGDECVGIYQNALSAKRIESSIAVIFKNTIINNGSTTAVNEISGFGGVTACTLIEPRILGTGNPFDSASLTRYQTNLDIPVRSSKSLRHMDRGSLAETAIGAAGTWNPENHTATDQPFLIGRFNGTTGTLGAPVVSATGMRLSIMLRAANAAGSVVTADAVYKLTPNTIAALAAGGANGERMTLEFIYVTSAWRQVGEAAWAAA